MHRGAQHDPVKANLHLQVGIGNIEKTSHSTAVEEHGISQNGRFQVHRGMGQYVVDLIENEGLSPGKKQLRKP